MMANPPVKTGHVSPERSGVLRAGPECPGRRTWYCQPAAAIIQAKSYGRNHEQAPNGNAVPTGSDAAPRYHLPCGGGRIGLLRAEREGDG
jgi:hypothetical protein